jgi:hypothetical protein
MMWRMWVTHQNQIHVDFCFLLTPNSCGWAIMHTCAHILAVVSIYQLALFCSAVVASFILALCFDFFWANSGSSVEAFSSERLRNSFFWLQGENDPYAAAKELGIFKLLESPLNMTTSTIIQRILTNHEAYKVNNNTYPCTLICPTVVGWLFSPLQMLFWCVCWYCVSVCLLICLITVQLFLLFANTYFVPQSMSDVAKFRWVHFFDWWWWWWCVETEWEEGREWEQVLSIKDVCEWWLIDQWLSKYKHSKMRMTWTYHVVTTVIVRKDKGGCVGRNVM